jgi:hypothetical protein
MFKEKKTHRIRQAIDEHLWNPKFYKKTSIWIHNDSSNFTMYSVFQVCMRGSSLDNLVLSRELKRNKPVRARQRALCSWWNKSSRTSKFYHFSFGCATSWKYNSSSKCMNSTMLVSYLLMYSEELHKNLMKQLGRNSFIGRYVHHMYIILVSEKIWLG